MVPYKDIELDGQRLDLWVGRRVIVESKCVEDVAPNTLTMRIQPDEGITLKFVAKVPGPEIEVEPVAMDFSSPLPLHATACCRAKQQRSFPRPRHPRHIR